MFVTIKFGDDVSQICNPNCRNDVFLQHIKKKCKLVDCEDVLELSDERGVVKNLRNFPMDYAAEHLNDRETLVLLRVEGVTSRLSDDHGGYCRSSYIPLLHGLEDNVDFQDMLNPKSESLSDCKSESRSARRKGGAKSKLSKKISNTSSNTSKEKVNKKH